MDKALYVDQCKCHSLTASWLDQCWEDFLFNVLGVISLGILNDLDFLMPLCFFLRWIFSRPFCFAEIYFEQSVNILRESFSIGEVAASHVFFVLVFWKFMDIFNFSGLFTAEDVNDPTKLFLRLPEVNIEFELEVWIWTDFLLHDIQCCAWGH